MGCIQVTYSGSLLVRHSTAIFICRSLLPFFFLLSLFTILNAMLRGRPHHSEFNFHVEYFQEHLLAASRKVFHNFSKRAKPKLDFSVNIAPMISQDLQKNLEAFHFKFSSCFRRILCHIFYIQNSENPLQDTVTNTINVKLGYVLENCFSLLWKDQWTKFLLTLEYY